MNGLSVPAAQTTEGRAAMRDTSAKNFMIEGRGQLARPGGVETQAFYTMSHALADSNFIAVTLETKGEA